MDKVSKQMANGTALAAIAAVSSFTSRSVLADAPSYPSVAAMDANGYAAGVVFDTPPEFTLAIYGIVVLTLVCLAALLWLMLRDRPRRKPSPAADVRKPGALPLGAGGAAPHLLTGGRIGYPRPM